MAARVLAAVVLILLGSVLARPDRDPAGHGRAAARARPLRVGPDAASTGVRYRRVLGARHVAFGDDLPLAIEVWNRRRLPLAWLRADDDASPGVEVRERDLVTDEAKPARPAQRVDAAAVRARRAPVPRQRATGAACTRSGPVELSIGDPFARRAAIEERDEVGHVPRLAADDRHDRARADRPLGRPRPGAPAASSRTRRGSPACGRTRRAIRCAASTPARARGSTSPMLKRFEPSRDREVLVALDVQTSDGPAWDLGLTDDEVEALYVVAASLVRQLARRRRRVRVHGGGLHGRRDADRAGARLDGARARRSACSTSSRGCPSTPRCRSSGCSSVAARDARPGSTVIVLTARDPRPFALALRRLERARRRTWSSSPAAAGRGAGAASRAAPRVRRPARDDGRPVAHRGAAGDRAVTLRPSLAAAAGRRRPAPRRTGRRRDRAAPDRARAHRRGRVGRHRRRAAPGVHAPPAGRSATRGSSPRPWPASSRRASSRHAAGGSWSGRRRRARGRHRRASAGSRRPEVRAILADRRARRPRAGDRRQHRRLARARSRSSAASPTRGCPPTRTGSATCWARGPGPRGRRDHRRHGGGAVARRLPRGGAGRGRSCSSLAGDHGARARAARARRDRRGRGLAPQPRVARAAARAARRSRRCARDRRVDRRRPVDRDVASARS